MFDDICICTPAGTAFARSRRPVGLLSDIDSVDTS